MFLPHGDIVAVLHDAEDVLRRGVYLLVHSRQRHPSGHDLGIMLAELVLQVREAPVQFHFFTTQFRERGRCGELGNAVDIPIAVDQTPRLFEVGVLVVDLLAGSHQLSVEVANLLLFDFAEFAVADAALNLQFLYRGFGLQDAGLEIVDMLLEPGGHATERFLPRFPLTGEVIVRDRGRQPLRLDRIPRCCRNGDDVGVLGNIQSLDQLIRRLIQLLGLLLRRAKGSLIIVISPVRAAETKPLRQIRDSKPLRQTRNSEPVRQIRDSKLFRNDSKPLRKVSDRKAAGLELRVRVEAKLAGDAQRDRFRLEDVDLGVDRIVTEGVHEGGDGFLDRGVDLLLRIVDEYLDR